MFSYEVAIDRFGQTPGALNASVAGQRGISLHFHDVPLAPGQIGRKVVQLFAGRWPQNRLATVKRYFHLGGLAVLVQTINGRVQPVHVAGCALRRGIGILRLIAGVHCHLVGLVGSGPGPAYPRLRPRIQVPNVASVPGVHFIQLAELALDGFHAVVDPLLARKGIDPAPESLFGLFDLRRRGHGGGRLIGGHGKGLLIHDRWSTLLVHGSRSILLVGRGLPLLREGGECNRRCQQNQDELAWEQGPK